MKPTPQPGSEERVSVTIARLILRTRASRRNLMFWLTLATLGATALGAFVLMEPLAEAPLLFLIYWAFVGFMLLFLILLALYDLLSVGREIRAEAREQGVYPGQTPVTDLSPDEEESPDEDSRSS